MKLFFSQNYQLQQLTRLQSISLNRIQLTDVLNQLMIECRVLPHSSSQIYIDFLPASFKYASLVALVELYRNWYLVLIRIMR
jgi:hypothetical protein